MAFGIVVKVMGNHRIAGWGGHFMEGFGEFLLLINVVFSKMEPFIVILVFVVERKLAFISCPFLP